MDKVKEMQAYAKQYDIPIMEEYGINFLCEFIDKHKIKDILEIGTAIAYSAIRMAMLDSTIQVTSIERDTARYEIAVKNVKDCGLEKQIHLIQGDALTTKIEGAYDMIFIDAAKAQYIRFFERYESLLRKDGYIISDNLKFHGFVDHPEMIETRNLRQLVRKIQNYIDYLEERSDFETEFIDLGDGIATSRRKSINILKNNS